MWWNGCLSIVKIATLALKTEGSSRVPTLMMIEPGRFGERVPMAVPQRAQNSRDTGVAMSLRENNAGSPCVKRNPSSGSTVATFGLIQNTLATSCLTRGGFLLG